jgi:4-amino-4-deoxy-L-arabinose transferase-like glycosyltransferase
VAPYHSGVVRSPGYPAFLAALQWVGGRHAVVIQAVQFALLAATSIMVGLIGRAVARPAVGNLAAVLCATYLPLLGFATVFLTETVTTCLLTGVVLLLLRARTTAGARIWVAIGLALAAATYVRPDSALLAIPLVLILLLSRGSSVPLRGRATAAAVLAAALLVPLIPWLIRDATATGGRVIPLEANGGVSLLASADQYHGLLDNGMARVKVWNAQVGRIAGVPAAAAEGIQAPVKYASARGQVRVDDLEQTAALKLFRSLSPGTVIAAIPRRLAALWGVGDETPPAKAGPRWHHLAQIQYVVLVLLALIGAAVGRRRLLSDWPLWLVGAELTVAHLLFPSEARYTLLARPTLMVYSAVGLLAAIALVRRRQAGSVLWPETQTNQA